LDKITIVFLHSSCSPQIAVGHGAVDDVEVGGLLVLVQSQLEVGPESHRVVQGAPLDVEDAIGSSTRHRGVNPAGASRIIRTAGQLLRGQIFPVRDNGIVVGGPRQTEVSKGEIYSGELGIAVG
jgi:hypothetical protein